MSDVTAFHRMLEQELNSLLRGASLECLVCGEFVLHEAGAISCPKCGARLRDEAAAESGVRLRLQAG